MRADDVVVKVFLHGALLGESVQRHVFGDVVPGVVRELLGHAFADTVTDGPESDRGSRLTVPTGLRRDVDSSVRGVLIALGEEQLRVADERVSAGVRRRVLGADGDKAWAYLDPRPLAVAQRISVIGDSVAAGRVDPAGGWAHRFATAHVARNEPRNRFFNLAVPGMTAERLLDFGAEESSRRRADTVIIAAGVNDLILGASPAAVVDRVSVLAEHVEDFGARPVVLGPLAHDEARTRDEFGAELPAEDLGHFRDLLLRWCQETRRDVVDPFELLAGRNELLADGLHPTATGHRIIGDFLLDGAGLEAVA